MYQVGFYTPLNRPSPIRKFLDSCQPSLRAKILRQLKYIKEFGLTQEVPNIKNLTKTPFWELRILGKDNVRIICVSLTTREIKVLHIFKKKKQKTPSKELQIAFERHKQLLDT